MGPCDPMAMNTLGGSGAGASPLMRQGHRRLMTKSLEKREGVKGIFPACCLLLWGREGVILLSIGRD